MRILFYIFSFAFTFNLIGQDFSTYKNINYTIEDGLPSNECHVALQDSLGYIWIATDRGLSRFDGYVFKNYGIKEGLSDISCLQMQIDAHNNIWLRTYSNKLFIYDHAIDSIITYKYNDLMQKFLGNSKVSDFVISEDTLYLSIHLRGLIKIDSNGKLYPFISEETESFFTFLEIDNKILTYSNSVSNVLFSFKDGSNTTVSKLKYKETFYNPIYLKENVKYRKEIAFKTNDNRILYYYVGYAYFFNSIELNTIIPSRGFKDMIFLPDNNILTAELEKDGVKLFENINDINGQKYKSVLSNVSASNLFIDKDGNLFITTLENGIYVFSSQKIVPIKNPIIQSKEIINIEAESLSEVYLNQNYDSVVKLNLETGIGSIIDFAIFSKLYDLYVDFNSNTVIYGSFRLSYIFQNGNKKIIQSNGFNLRVKKVKRLANGNYIFLTISGMAEYQDIANSPIFETYPYITRLAALDALDYKEGYLLGCIDGLYYLKDYKKIKLDSIHPFFNNRINSIEKINGLYYLGSMGEGIGIWDGDNSLKIINISDGLVSNNIESLVTDAHSILLACTKSGLSKITLRDTLAIKNYTSKDGLPSNQVNDAVIINDTIIVATAKGLAYLSDVSKYIAAKTPIIEEFTVNNISLTIDSINLLKYYQNALSISFKSLDYSQYADINYSYSLNNEPWVITNDTKVNFSSLSPDEYTFKVRASNSDGIWSDTSQLSFQVNKPWWRNNWFLLLIAISVIGAIYYYYHNRLQKERKILKLERAALKAQMNPHFIFNCLNSIQSYIIHNDKELAMDYLSRFAKLIRQHLNASASEKINLASEIAMLDNYLFLEKIRFNHSFEYRFTIAEHISTEDTYIPALLIQPIVENAVLHGMKDKKQGGLIEIYINKVNNQLEVIIKDNGSGIKKETLKSNRKSFGVSITKQRLEHINKYKDNYTVSLQDDMTGTEVKINITI